MNVDETVLLITMPEGGRELGREGGKVGKGGWKVETYQESNNE